MVEIIKSVLPITAQLKPHLQFLYRWIVTHPMQVLIAMGSWFLVCGVMDWCEHKFPKRRAFIYVWKTLVGGVLFATVVMIFYVTLANRYPNDAMKYKLDLFWSYKQVIQYKNEFILWQIIWNILAFIPFGNGLYYLLGKKRTWYKVALIAAVFSSYIELTQLYKRMGLFEFDDIFHNTIGAILGSFMAMFIVRVTQMVEKRRNIR